MRASSPYNFKMYILYMIIPFLFLFIIVLILMQQHLVSSNLTFNKHVKVQSEQSVVSVQCHGGLLIISGIPVQCTAPELFIMEF